MKGPVLVLIFVVLDVIHADIHSIRYPHQLEQCYKSFGREKAETSVGENIACFCISSFTFYNKQRIKPHVPTCSERAYINKMSENPNKKRREKRGTFLPPGRRRVRKEYRMLSRTERSTYHNCMQRLKTTTRENSRYSIYDELAMLHSEEIIAHDGTNFLPWHRVYLWTLENELRSLGGECSSVTLPYWDCTAEFYANIIEYNSAEDSIIFSDEFAGTGSGLVNNGPFRTWGLFRRIREQGVLFGRERIEELKRFGTNPTISNPSSSLSIEREHNKIHNFLGGDLLDISRAPRDPMFFLLHCFIDFVWQEVRNAMRRRGLDPSIYPSPTSNAHAAHLQMDGFDDWKNEEGFSNLWDERHVEYEPSYSCEQNRCNNIEGLRCVNIQGTSQCVAERQQPFWWNWFSRKKRDINKHHFHDCTSAHFKLTIDSNIKVCNQHTCPSGPSSIQNTFTLNDVTDASLWVYIPVKVIYERRHGLRYDAYATYTGNNVPTVNSTRDIYDPAFNPELARHLYTGDARPYKSCRISGEGAAKVYIRTDGINYSGISVEYAIMDERYPISSQKAFIPIKDPTFNDTEVCLVAYDSCGTLCLPTCRIRGSYPPAYAPCTGCVRVNNLYPKKYGRSVADIVADQWSFHDVGYNKFLDPTESDKDIFLKFVCDSSSEFPWQRQNHRY